MTTTNQQPAESKCVMGCMHYDGGEIKHHKDCPYYPDSLTKYNDDLQNQLREENERLQNDIGICGELIGRILGMLPDELEREPMQRVIHDMCHEVILKILSPNKP